MNEKNLVICDSEFRYADNLGRNIAQRTELSVKVCICSNLESVLQFAKQREIHILVIDEKYRYEDRCRVMARQIFVLCENRVEDLGEEECAIRKYQKADHIIQELFDTYIEKTQENIFRNARQGKAKCIAVYSPIHRVGKTKFAIGFGKECAKTKKTLYINLEEYVGFEVADEKGLNMADLLYYLQQENGNFHMHLQTAIQKMGDLEFLIPVPMSQDLRDITFPEWKMFLEQIMGNSAYEIIILDVGEGIQGLYFLLECCDQIYMPILKDEASLQKLLQYDRTIENLKMDKLPRATYRFVMPENVEEYARMRAKEEC